MDALTEAAIVVEHAGVKFDLRYTGGRTLRRTMADWLALRRSQETHEFWAFRDVDVFIRLGDSLGVIGQNGSGKSTLLLSLAGVLEPDEGAVRSFGHTTSLLTLGSGFEPELTGRQNVYLNGAYLGLSRAAIEGKLDEIVEFSELGKFADVPLKKYSTGMRMRLAFSIASHIEPDILLLDEVLGVGDAGFQAKSKARLGELMERSKAIVLVSHNMSFVRDMCSHVLWLDQGRVAGFGTPQEVIPRYQAHVGVAQPAPSVAGPATATA